MRRAVPVIIGVLLALAVLGLTVRLLTVPAFTEYLVRQTGGIERSGLAEESALATAQHVRGYVTGARDDALPAEVDGQPGFTEDEVSHLDDVAAVFAAAGWATLVFAAVCLAWLGFAAKAGERAGVRRALVTAGVILVGLAGAAVVVALTDFDRFFAGFHALFFEPGTWQFPADSLLIRLFAEPFWATAGAVWGALVVAAGVGLSVVGLRLRPHVARDSSA